MVIYYVYKASRDGRRFKNWEYHSEFEDLSAAERAARDLCPKGEAIETEPGHGLDRAFFGSQISENWCAQISPITRSPQEGVTPHD